MERVIVKKPVIYLENLNWVKIILVFKMIRLFNLLYVWYHVKFVKINHRNFTKAIMCSFCIILDFVCEFGGEGKGRVWGVENMRENGEIFQKI